MYESQASSSTHLSFHYCHILLSLICAHTISISTTQIYYYQFTTPATATPQPSSHAESQGNRRGLAFPQHGSAAGQLVRYQLDVCNIYKLTRILLLLLYIIQIILTHIHTGLQG
jgi:hypothetical protein